MPNRTAIFTVTQVNSLIKQTLENNLPPRLTVAGEISDWHHHQSGHCYFSLRDENAVLPCVMWKSRFSKVKFQPENGLAILATGSIDIYPPQGKYQFYVDSVTPAGIGNLQLAFEQMYKRLKEEGLFEEKYKKPLPKFPMRIGILTSESGAAIEDIKDSIWNRWLCAKLFLHPVPVQGEGAAEKIAAALRYINRKNKKLNLDILIVGRGGGSLEDLWAFNEEVLARAIFDSAIPVISAVGHEIDTTIADLVADKRASTPTKAGVAAVPDTREILEQLMYYQEKLETETKLRVRNAEQQLDESRMRITSSAKQLLAEARARLYEYEQQIRKIEPHQLLKNKTLQLNNLKNQANTAIKAVINKAQIHLTAAANRLSAMNPKSVLQRGYSITTDKKTGLLVKTAKDVQTGDLIITEFAKENLIESKVTKK